MAIAASTISFEGEALSISSKSSAQPVQKEHDGSGIDPARKESWIIQQHTGEVILFDFRHEARAVNPSR